MEYTIQKLAQIAGVSTRTLRYYDEIGLLKPARINSSGYRIYGQQEIASLQQILFYRELNVGLNEIKNIITDPNFDEKEALMEHRKQLLEKKRQLNLLIENVDKTIAEKEGGTQMSDKEKFVGFKKKVLEENENKYGEEIREKYGEETVKKSNKKFMDMTQEQHEEAERISKEILDTLSEAMKTGDPKHELAQKAADLHKKWLTFYWPSYSKEAHAGLAQMYVDDERFTAFYDDHVKPGAAKFLRDAIHIYTGATN